MENTEKLTDIKARIDIHDIYPTPKSITNEPH